MRINHNIAALNTYRQLTTNTTGTSKSLEKLSAGLRINKAGDDAAGLAISEKMRGQIRGLGQASRNAQDGISLIQTAEGALNETHSILQRMRELAVQSSTDTNTAEDRVEIQKEINELAEEISRIADTTEFNTQNLLGGKFESKFHIGANEGQNVGLSINAMDAKALKVAGAEAATFEITGGVVDGSDGDDANVAVNFDNGTYNVIAMADYEGEDLVLANIQSATVAAVTHVMVDAEGNAVGTSEGGLVFNAIGSITGGAGTDSTRATMTFTNAPVGEVTIDGATASGKAEIADSKLEGGTYTVVNLATNPTYSGTWGVGLADANGNLVALGANASGVAVADAANATDVANWVDLNDTSKVLLSHTAGDLGLGSEIEASGKGIDVSNQVSADNAITTINDAIVTVSAERSKLGAMQNRLEHTIANLDTSAENMQASEGRIRDVDMAKEMMEFTKNNILSQAAQAMLAQANQQPQSVLQLLQ